MKRPLAVLIGALAGLLLAGLVTAIAVPTLPPEWHSRPVVWSATALLVGGSVAAAVRWSAPRKA